MQIQEAPPSVVYVDQTGQLGGAEISLLDLIERDHGRKRVILFEEGPFADELRARGIDTVVCRLGDRASSVRKRSGLFSKLLATGDLVEHRRSLREAIDGFDVVYANTPKALVTAAAATRNMSNCLIYHLRDMINASHFSSMNRWMLVKLSNRYASAVIANSRATADAFTESGGDPDIVRVIHNGFDSTPFVNASHQSDMLRHRQRDSLGVRRDAFVVAVFGRLAEWKGQHIAIEAIRDLPGAHLWIVGDALFGEDDAYRLRLKRLVNEYNLESRVSFLGQRNDVASLMQATDVVVHCSTAPEPFGRVIVEAMLSQRPVIASDAGGAVEILDDGQNGMLTPIGDAAALARAVDQIMKDTDLAHRLAKAGRDDALRRFRIEDRVAELREVIDAATCGRPMPTRRTLATRPMSAQTKVTSGI